MPVKTFKVTGSSQDSRDWLDKEVNCELAGKKIRSVSDMVVKEDINYTYDSNRYGGRVTTVIQDVKSIVRTVIYDD